MGVSRHESCVEGALGEDRPKMIGQPERDKERIGDGASAENRGEHDIARESGDPREQRVSADGENTPQHQMSLLPRMPLSSPGSTG